MTRRLRTLAALTALAATFAPLPARAAVTYDLLAPFADFAGQSGYLPQSLSTSANGRFVVYSVPDGGSTVVYVFDRATQRSEMISVAPGGGVKAALGPGPVFSAGSISADGRYVAFCSWSTNLVPGDRNFFVDVFLRDRTKHTTTRISLDPKGRELSPPADAVRADLTKPGSPADCQVAISADGSRVLWRTSQDVLGDRAKTPTFYSYSRATRRIVPVDRLPGTVTGSGAEVWHGSSAMSADGRYVVFSTAARMAPADTDNETDVYRRDLVTGALTMVTDPGVVAGDEAAKSAADLSKNTDHALPDATLYRQATIDASGRHVAFLAMDLRNRLQDGPSWNVADTHARVMVADPVARTASALVSRARTARLNPDSPDGLLADPVIAADGRSVYYLRPQVANDDVSATDPTTDPPDPLHNWSALAVVPAPGGTSVTLTSPQYVGCTVGMTYCVSTQTAALATPSGGDIEAYALTASGHELLFWTNTPFVSADTNTKRDLYVWHG